MTKSRVPLFVEVFDPQVEDTLVLGPVHLPIGHFSDMLIDCTLNHYESLGGDVDEFPSDASAELLERVGDGPKKVVRLSLFDFEKVYAHAHELHYPSGQCIFRLQAMLACMQEFEELGCSTFAYFVWS